MNAKDPLTYEVFSDEEINTFLPPMKIGILGTVTPQGLPHLTLISSLMASSPTQLAWGQFVEGESKSHILHNSKTGFLLMTLDKRIWQGKAIFTHKARNGKEYDYYNNTPMFRYNAYFGIHTVYYMDLVEHHGELALPMNEVVFAAIQTRMAKIIFRSTNQQSILNQYTTQLYNGISNLKFISYIDQDGFPVITPLIQAQAYGASSLIFSTSAFRHELSHIPPKSTVAAFGMALSMEDVLVRGTFRGYRSTALGVMGFVDVDWVYNPMPPKPQQIYPPVELKPIIDF